MNKDSLIPILLIDAFIVIFAISLISIRYNNHKRIESLGQPVASGDASQLHTTPRGADTPPKTKETPPQDLPVRNILFQYRSSRANSVSIIGDFNDWTPEPLTKTKKNLWEIALKMSPGQYNYNFLVDGQVVLDPNNFKTPADTSRGFKSSVLDIRNSGTKTKK
ncbi:MAG: glycogen-binding domain-containing protein [Elusimicrobiota bacterium]